MFLCKIGIKSCNVGYGNIDSKANMLHKLV